MSVENLKKRNQIIEDYSKKIYGFAYGKLKNTYDAEDLSSEIILNLCQKDWTALEVVHMDAYIYKICQFTWSKFLKSHKRDWQALNNLGLEDLAVDQADMEAILEKEETQLLRQEVVQLSKLKREIVIGHYYDLKKSDRIADDLKLNPSTVRWHLLQVKKELKMRMEDKDIRLYKPVKLWLGHHGWYDNETYKLLERDVLLQNVCYLCQSKPMTIEAIARELGVASIYFEDKLKDMVDLDYMVKKRDKYQTNFFIQDANYYQHKFAYLYDRLDDISLAIYRAIQPELPAIRAIGFIGSDLDQLLWYLLPLLISTTVDLINKSFFDHLKNQIPARIDGTCHWLVAGVMDYGFLEEIAKEDPGFADYCRHGNGMALKSRSNAMMASIQYDSAINGQSRDFEVSDLMTLKHVHRLIQEGGEVNDYDKEVLLNLMDKGYVAYDQAGLTIRVPYLTVSEMKSLKEIVKKVAERLLSLKSVFRGYRRLIKSLMPGHLSENEKNHYLKYIHLYYGVMKTLMDKGYLKEASDEEMKVICTLVWEKEGSKDKN